MLKSFRNNDRIRNIIILVVVVLLASYVVVGFGSAPPKAQGDTIAKLGSTRIKLRDAWIQQETISNRYRQFAQLDATMLKSFTVNQLINDAVIIDAAHQLGLTVSDDELRDFIIRYRSPGGEFLSDEDYAYAIKNRYRVQVDSFEAYMRDHSLLVQKYGNLFFGGAYVSEKDIQDRFAEQNRKVKLEYLTVATFEVRDQAKLEKDADIQKLIDAHPEKFQTGPTRKLRFVRVPYSTKNEVTGEEIDVTPEEIEAYYQANIERFRQQERVTASHILIKADNRTDEEALALAQKVRGEIEGGLAFDEAAKKYSQDESNKDRGGSLGTFPRGQMVKPFEDAVFAMDEGGLSNPVKTQFGYHLIKKDAHHASATQPLEVVSGGIETTLKRNLSKAAALEVMNAFHKALDGKDFETAAAEAQLEVQETPYFDSDARSSLGDVLKNNFQARKKAFEFESVNDVSEPMSLNNEAVVMQYLGEGEPQTLTLASDANRVRVIAEAVAGEAFIRSAFDAIRKEAEANPEKALKDLRGKRDWLKDNQFKETDWIGAAAMPNELRSAEVDFEKDLYSLEPGSFLPVQEAANANRFVLVRVTDKQEPDMSKLEEARHDIIFSLRNEAAGDLYAAYQFGLRNDLDPEGKVQAEITKALNPNAAAN